MSSDVMSVSNAEAAVRPRGVRPAAAQHRRRRWIAAGATVGVVLLVLAAAAGPLGVWPRLLGTTDEATDVYRVVPTILNVTLEEEGELKPVNSVDIKCEVQGQNMTIQWIVPESSAVKKGDLLVRLAADELKDRVEMEEIELKKITAGLEEARQALEITRSENASAIKRAEIDLQVAELEYTRYVEGDYAKARQSIEIAIKQTEIDIAQRNDELEKSRRLFEREFISRSEIKKLEDALEKAQMTLRLNKLEADILDNYELPKNKIQKQSAVQRATEELEREKQRAASRERQADARVADQAQTLDIRTRRFERLKDQLAKCEICAPVDGVVQYGGGGSRQRWYGGNRIAVGERVYDGQTLITLPDTSQMMVATRIHEADRHKIREGLTCLVRVPAVPGQTFTAKLTKIAQFADSEGSWWNPNLKEHAAEAVLTTTAPELSPGDTAHVEILIEEIPDVLAVPVQSVFVRGAKRFVFVRDGADAAPVEVKVGRTSTTMIEITEGVAAGSEVMMAADEQMLAKLPMPGTGENGAPETPEPALGKSTDKAADDPA